MSGLGKRLDALEQIAEQARVSALREQFAADFRQRGVTGQQAERHIARLLDIDRQIRAWQSAGVSRVDIVRRCAVEIGVDPEQFARQFAKELAARVGS